jgi:hypothetical protein
MASNVRPLRRAPLPTTVVATDFYAYLPTHRFLFVPTRQLWPGASINVALGQIAGMNAAAWLDANRPVHQMSWSPGDPELIRDRLVAEGGWIEKAGACCFNQYRQPVVKEGNPKNAKPWLDHIAKVYPDDADHIVKCFAHRVQRPQDKLNHALVLGGAPRVGKDSLIAPLRHAVGAWNFHEIAPSELTGRFNGYRKAVVLRISEARDLGEVNRFAFYEAMKVLAASPPEALRVDEKHLAEYYIPNLVWPIITTNYKTDALYLPPDDRRHYVAWSPAKESDFEEGYWNRLWRYYDNGGLDDCAAYLADLDISEFDVKAPPPKTPAFYAIVNAQRGAEEPELEDLLDSMSRPIAVTLETLIRHASGTEIFEWLKDRKNRRIVGHRLERCGYERLDNDLSKDGLFVVGGKRQAAYVNMLAPVGDRWRAARDL